MADVNTDTATSNEVAEKVEVVLDVHLARHLLTATLMAPLGAFLLVYTGPLFRYLGLALLLWAGYHAIRAVIAASARRPAIVVTQDGVVVPRSRFRKARVRLPREAIRAAFLLREAVPWHAAAPVLVIEGRDEVLWLPRDWFYSEADQRKLVDALAHSH